MPSQSWARNYSYRVLSAVGLLQPAQVRVQPLPKVEANLRAQVRTGDERTDTLRFSLQSVEFSPQLLQSPPVRLDCSRGKLGVLAVIEVGGYQLRCPHPSRSRRTGSEYRTLGSSVRPEGLPQLCEFALTHRGSKVRVLYSQLTVTVKRDRETQQYGDDPIVRAGYAVSADMTCYQS